MRSSQSNAARTPSRILLVDDNHDGVFARQAILQELGYTVCPAHSGEEALALFDREKFDLIITDYKMAPVDGLELIKTVRSRGSAVPIILLSGFADTIGLRTEATGANAVVQKSAHEIGVLIRHTKRLLSPAKKPAASQRGASKARAKGSL